MNFRRLQESASDLAHTYASSFVYGCVDPTGGGWEAMDVYAHPNAVSADAPTEDPEPPTIPQPAVDPMTGQPALGLDGQPMMQDAPNPKYLGPSAGLVRRFVMPDSSLSATSKGARKRWLPKVKYQLLPSLNVAFVPHTVTQGIDEAEGVVLCVPTTIGELKRKFPETVGKYDADKLQALAQWRPRRFAMLKETNPAYEGAPKSQSEPVTDDQPCYPLTLYFRSKADYPLGAYILVAANDVLHRQAWHVTHEQTGEDECLDLPLAQCRDMDGTHDGDPFGKALAEYLGPLDEINGQVWVYLLEYLYRHGNPNVFTLSTSPVQPEELRRRDGTPIEILTRDDMPLYEQVPDLPRQITEIAKAVSAELNSESGLEQAAQGVASASVQSGRHAEQIIEQALVALGTMKRNVDDFITRLWRIHLQLVRAFFTVPQTMRYETDDGSWKVREWTNVDLLSTKDVRIARGTSTMQPAGAKRAQALEDLQAGVIDLDEFRELTAQHSTATFGRQDNPHRQRVMRQIAAWKDGPETIDGVADEELTTEAAGVFAPLPTDEDPVGARIRYRELTKLVNSTAFLKHPPAWRQPVLLALEAARFNAGIQTAAQQAQAAQQQAMVQQPAPGADGASVQQGDATEAQAATAEMRGSPMAA